MPFDRVATLLGVLLVAVLLCAVISGDEPTLRGAKREANHPFALPNSLQTVPLTESSLALPRKPEHATAADSPAVADVSEALDSAFFYASSDATVLDQAPRSLRQLPPPRHAMPFPNRLKTGGMPEVEMSSPKVDLQTRFPLDPPERLPNAMRSSGRRKNIMTPLSPAWVAPDQSPVSSTLSDPAVVEQAGGAKGLSRRRLTGESTASSVRDSAYFGIHSPGIRLVAEEQSVLVPLRAPQIDENVDLLDEQGLVTLIANGAELKSVLRMIADHHQLNLVLGPSVEGPVTVSIRGAKLEVVLDAILGVAGFAWHRVDNLLYVTSVDAQGMDPRVQGRSVQVYQLDYVAAADVQQVATGLLSPVGNAFINESDSMDELRTRETLVVEDTPAAHRRISDYISQVDVPPMQVLIEAHVLQISLGHEEQHGIDLQALLRMNGSVITLDGLGFTDLAGSESDLAIRINGTDLDSVIQLIRRCTNSRTLASPKVSVLNRQEAKIQIGQRLPYAVATTTQTTTVESVEFLEVGIVLTVCPVITEDGNVLMHVFPKVSGGKITQNGYPEEETTEVQTTIMIPDGGGIVIGGLIREEQVQARAVVPYFNKVPVLGHLFKRRSDETRRNELVVALVARVINDGQGPRLKEVMDLETALPEYAASELMQR